MKYDQISEAYIDLLEAAKWRQGYAASGHPAGFKHKNGDVGPVGGSFSLERGAYDDDDKKVPVNKYREQDDPLQSRADKKLDMSTKGLKLTKKNAQKNLKNAIIQSKGKHGPVNKLPESVQYLLNLDEAALDELISYLDFEEE